MAEPLVVKPEDKIISAYDIYGKEHKRNLKNFCFRASAYGLLRRNDEILVNRNPLLTNQFGLPGGGINMDETIKQGLLREFEEETGLKIRIKRLVSVEDSFFTHKDQDVHGILIFYEVEKVSGCLQTNTEDSVEVKYMNLDELDNKNIMKAFRHVIRNLK